MSSGLYIHIPYCKKKCGYCGFVSYPLSYNTVPDIFIHTLLDEMALYHRQKGKLPVDTVFIGGGTPSLLTAAQFTALMDGVRTYFDVAADAEITCEANPDSLSEDVLRSFSGNGVNRLSIGAQSMDADLLKILGRIHDRDTFLRAHERAVSAGFTNINVDLMFGLPGQSYAQWMQSLEEVLALSPAHLSLYTIQIEEGTPFYQLYKDGQIDLPPVNEDRRMYHDAVSVLQEAGFAHYEISNFAKTEKRCRHNMKYWTMAPFIGLGPSAASYYDGYRYQNAAALEDWTAMVQGERLAKDTVSKESAEDAMEVFCFTSLRTADGLDLDLFRSAFGCSLDEAYRDDPLPLQEWIEKGWIRFGDGRLVLTESGIDISNEIMSAFMRG